MNVEKLNELINNDALDAQALEARRWAIIINAVQELTRARGYTGPMRDNDMRVAMAIKAAASRLQDDYNAVQEHAQLVPVDPRQTDPVIDKVYNMLEKELSDEAVPRASEAPVARHPLPPKGHK